MDLVLKARGLRITDQLRRSAEHKLAKLERLHRLPARVEVEVIEENPRIDGGHRVDVSYSTGRRTFRAEGAGRDVDTALDQVAERLERQLSTYRSKRRQRLTGRGYRLQSTRTSSEASGTSE